MIVRQVAESKAASKPRAGGEAKAQGTSKAKEEAADRANHQDVGRDQDRRVGHPQGIDGVSLLAMLREAVARVEAEQGDGPGRTHKTCT